MLHYFLGAIFLSAIAQHGLVRRYLVLAFVTGLMLHHWVPFASVSAATHTWIGSGTNGNWGDIFQWAGFNAPPTSGVNTAIVMQGSDTSPDIQGIGNNDVDYDIDSITLSPAYIGGGTMFLSGGELTVDNEIVNNSTQKLQFNTEVHLGDQSLEIDASIGDIIFRLPVSASGADPIISVSGLGDVFIDGGISGGSDTALNVLGDNFVRVGGSLQSLKELNISGSGTVQIENSFASLSSGLSIDLANDATFDLNNVPLLMNRLSGSGSVDLGTASLTLQNNSNSTYIGVISGAGSIRQLSSGELMLRGINTYTGTTTISAGTIRILSSSNLGSGDIIFDFGDGTLATIGHFTNTRGVTIDANNSATIDVSGVLTQSGLISGDATTVLIKNGSGMLRMTANYVIPFQGDVEINEGVFDLAGSGNVLSEDTNVAIGSLGTFIVNNPEGVGNLSGSGSVVLNQQLNVGFDDASTNFTGVVSGVGGLAKMGTGTLLLSGNNSYTGATNIIDGRIQLVGTGRLSNSTDVIVSSAAILDLNGVSDTVDSITGSGSVRLGGGTLTVDENTVNARVFSGAISESGDFAKEGTHLLVLTGNNTYTGTTTLGGGTLRVASNNNLGAGNLIFDGGMLNTTGSFASARTVSINANQSAVVDVDAATTLTQSGTIIGAISTVIVKEGGGMLRTTSPNGGTFFGDIVIHDGTFDLAGGGDGLSNTTTVTVDSPGTFLVNNPDDIGGLDGEGSVVLNQILRVGHDDASTTFSGVLSGSGLFGKRGTGTVTLTEVNTYTGPTDIDGGTLRLSGNGELSTSTDVDVAASATLELVNATTSINNLTGTGSVVLNANSALFVGQNGGSSTFGGVVSGAGDFAHLGAGTLTLTGNNTYTGTTTIATGTVKLGGPDRLSDVTDLDILAAAATFDLNGMDETVDSIGGGGSILLGGGTLRVGAANGSRTFSGVISGTGELRKVGKGSQVLTGTNLYSGSTFVDQGELVLSDGGSIDQQTMAIGHNPGDDGAVTVDGPTTTWSLSNKLLIGAGGGMGRLEVNNGATFTVASQVGIGSSLSAGTLSLDGGTFELSSGKIFIDTAGVLQGQGDVIGDILSNGTVAPGNSTGILSATGSYVQNAIGSLLIEIGGTTLGTEYDQLNITGTARLDGELRVQLIDGFMPSINDMFEILNASDGMVDVFATESLPNLGDGMDWDVHYNTFGTVLEVIATFTADFDIDGDVDGEDLTDPVNGWEARYGVDLDGRNFLDWQRQFGSGVPLLASSQTVPEPNTVVLLLLGFLGLLVPRQLGFRFFFGSTLAIVPRH